MVRDDFDRFFVNGPLFDGKGLDFSIATYRIPSPKFITQPYKMPSGKVEAIPFRYNTRSLDPRTAGYSDHFAIKGTLVFR